MRGLEDSLEHSNQETAILSAFESPPTQYSKRRALIRLCRGVVIRYISDVHVLCPSRECEHALVLGVKYDESELGSVTLDAKPEKISPVLYIHDSVSL